MGKKRPEENETKFQGKKACNESAISFNLKSENTECIIHVKTRSADTENTNDITNHRKTIRNEAHYTELKSHIKTSRDEVENTDEIKIDVTTSRNEIENTDGKTIHATTSRNEFAYTNEIKTYETTIRDEIENTAENNINATTSDEYTNIDVIQTNVTTSRSFNKNIDNIEPQVTNTRDGIKQNDCMETHSKSRQDCTEYTDGMVMHLTGTGRSHRDSDTSIDGDEHTECMKTHSNLSGDVTDTHESINGDAITRSNTDIVHSETIDSTKRCVNKKWYRKKPKEPKPSFKDRPCTDITFKLFEHVGITETEVIKYLKFYRDKKYVSKGLNPLDENSISVQFYRGHAELFYNPNDKNKDNYLSPSSEPLCFKKDEIKEFNKSRKFFTIKTGDMNIKSIALKINKIDADCFFCSVYVELNLRFELFKYIKGFEMLEVIRLQEGTLNEDNIFVLKLNDIYTHLEFIYLMGILGVTEKHEENNELEKKCIFLVFDQLVYKMKLYDFYIKFYAVIGQIWLWYDDNNKPQNPPDGDIINYTIHKDGKNKGFDGCKGLIDSASETIFKLCTQYFAGNHTTNNSDENLVADGTLVLAMMIAESIRNPNTVLINFIIFKLYETNDIAAVEYLRQHPMLFGGSWKNRKRTGFNFEPGNETLKREERLFDQYQKINPLLKEEKNIVKWLEALFVNSMDPGSSSNNVEI